MRRTVLLLAAVAIVGCQGWRLGGAGKPPVTTPSEQVSAPASLPPGPRAASAESVAAQPDRPVMAQVNGSPIYMDELHDLLVRADGLRVAKNVIASHLVDRAAAERGLTVTDQEIRSEHVQTLAHLFPEVPEQAQRERLFTELRLRRNIPPKQWQMSMRRNVLLGKLLTEEVQVSQDEVRRAYEDKYGRQVVVRHIQSATSAEAAEALAQLRAGANFAQLAGEISKNASAARGGLLPTVGAESDLLPKALHKVAWAMETPGELSKPVQVGTSYHILYLERVIEAQDVTLQDVAEQLRADIHIEKVREARSKLLQQMTSQADIKWADPILADAAARLSPGDQENLP